MKSHEYQVGQGELARITLSLFIPAILFAGMLRLGQLSHILPSPWPALDMDQTILTHQAQASQTAHDADAVLIGDSSCLMDVSAARLQEATGGNQRVLNLASFMYVGLNGYAAMLSRYAAVNSGRLRTVVVLLHPEMLRGVEPLPQYLVLLSDYYSGSDQSDWSSVPGRLRGFFGLDLIQDRILSRLPLPLPKEFGQFYGFNLNLYAFMDQQNGSVVDPRQFVSTPGQGNAEYRLAAALEPGCRALKTVIPPEAKLLIGITPIPESMAPKDYHLRYQEILAQWGQWMRADVLLSNLPPTMPDFDFASTTHLNHRGVEQYSRRLAAHLETHWNHQ